MTMPLRYELLVAGHLTNEEVCKLVGIEGYVSYGAQAPGDEHAHAVWYFEDFRSHVERAIEDANRRGASDWRHGSTLITIVNYPNVSEQDGPAMRVLDALVARGARVSLHNRAVGPWACSAIWKDGTSEERQFFEYGPTRALAICALVLSMRDILVAPPVERSPECAGGSSFDGDPSRTVLGQGVR